MKSLRVAAFDRSLLSSRHKTTVRAKSALTITLLMALFIAAAATPAHAQARLVVSPSGPYTTIQAALADAHNGDMIEVRAGTYRGPLVVEKSVTLQGVDAPVIDAGGQGTVVMLNAPDAQIRGFVVQGSGIEPDQDHAGITLSAPRTVAEGNQLRDVLFGIFVAKAADAIVRANDIESKREYDLGRKGDGIRLWYSPRVVVERNVVHDARDVVIWYSSDMLMRDNVITRGRYGVHLMYCDGAQIERNQVLDNSVGIYTMYSNNVALRDNLIRGQRGPSGYALGFKDADNITVTNSALIDNRGGAFVDGTPFTPQGVARFTQNIFAFNDVGVVVQPAVRGNLFADNTFWENVEQVSIAGGGNLGVNTWQGNYWSDYSGFDANGDAQGDAPYRAERFFESMMDREPLLRVLLYSPAAQAIEFAASAFPVVRPQPKISDDAPQMQPLAIPAFAVPPPMSSLPMIIAAFGLLAASVLGGGLAMIHGNLLVRRQMPLQSATTVSAQPLAAIAIDADTHTNSIRVLSVSKQYGKLKALNDVSFDARAGEAVALWGVNGAGKTTLIKAILGLIDFEGEIVIEGQNVRRNGKLARRSIGYVPQETIFYDWDVHATMAFYARLKSVDAARIPTVLARLGLSEHANKPVPALSGGLKQRLALAIALLADPPVLLLDEPTASLDTHARADYLALLSALRHEGKTIIFASHRLEEVESLADRVLVLEQGRVVDTLTPERLRAQWTPDVEMTLWVGDGQREQAQACLAAEGMDVHLNGRGTVVVRVPIQQKMRPLMLLRAQGITVSNFEIERGRTWN